MLAEKRWCLDGWTITKREITPVERGVIVWLDGACR
jgi:hypothetical protein